MSARTSCYGCGASVPNFSGPTHRYIGASPGCWAIYGEVLTREYGELGRPPELRVVVDAYAAQHPGRESLQAIRSVAGHLIALHLVLECGMAPDRISWALRRYSKRPEYRWLAPPAEPGAVTVVDLHAAQEREHCAQVCAEWAASVWLAWSEHHETIRSWAAR